MPYIAASMRTSWMAAGTSTEGTAGATTAMSPVTSCATGACTVTVRRERMSIVVLIIITTTTTTTIA